MEIDAVFEQLFRFQGKQFEMRKSGWPVELRQCMLQLCAIFETSEGDVRRDIISRVAPGISFLFISFSGLMAIDAVRRHDEQLVIRGLEALAMADRNLDSRDVTINIAGLYHSAVKIGANPTKLFDFVASLASARGKELIHSFLARSPENRQLSKFGIREGVTTTGEFTYE